jgi:hypothetical protein
MDGKRFDDLIAALAEPDATRRSLLRRVGVGGFAALLAALGLVPTDTTEVAAGRRRRRRRRGGGGGGVGGGSSSSSSSAAGGGGGGGGGGGSSSSSGGGGGANNNNNNNNNLLDGGGDGTGGGGNGGTTTTTTTTTTTPAPLCPANSVCCSDVSPACVRCTTNPDCFCEPLADGSGSACIDRSATESPACSAAGACDDPDRVCIHCTGTVDRCAVLCPDA